MTISLCILVTVLPVWAATHADEIDALNLRENEIQRGSQTARGGFQNENEIRDKFNNWAKDDDAAAWLSAMNFSVADIVDVVASKPHGKKSDVEVRVRTKHGERVEGISIKLVSNPNGYNQIDKRRLATYAAKWNMPTDVNEALKQFVGETPPAIPGRNEERMFLDEFNLKTQRAIVSFFSQHREEIVSDLFRGDGEHAANWMLVTLLDGRGHEAPKVVNQNRASEVRSRWILQSTADVIRFYNEGEVRITTAGSLRIGRITMQRKGGDNGRESAKMLQFKINPAQLFELAATKQGHLPGSE